MTATKIARLTALAISMCAAGRADAAPCQDRRAAVFFVNGILTTPDESNDTVKDLDRRLRDALQCVLPVIPAYNTTQGLGEDLEESFGQWMDERGLPRVDAKLFWLVVGGVGDIQNKDYVAAVARFTQFQADEMARNILEFAGIPTSQEEFDLQAHLELYGFFLRAGYNVVIVGHSQGNFFANREYDALVSEDSRNAVRVRVVAIATPASRVAGRSANDRYTTLRGDFIYQSVPTALKPANAEAPPDCTSDSLGVWSLVCHSVSTYLSAADSSTKILNNVITASASPTAAFTMTAGSQFVTSGPTPLTLQVFPSTAISVNFDAGVSTDPNGSLVGWRWTVDGLVSLTPNAPVFTLSFGLPIGSLARTYTVTLVVIDSIGFASQESVGTINVVALPAPNIAPTAGFTMTAGSLSARDGQTLSVVAAPTSLAKVTFNAGCVRGSLSCSSDPDGTVVGWEWLVDGTLSSIGSSVSVDVGLGSHTVSLVVTDNQGARSQPAQGLVLVSACASPPLGLVGLWPWEGSGADLQVGNNATFSVNPSFAPGKVGQALQFDGANDYAVVGASSVLDVGNGPGLTIETWINPIDVTNQRALVEWNNGFTIGAHFWISVPTPPVAPGTGPGSIYANLDDVFGNLHVIASAPNLLQANVFQHVAVTYDKLTGLARLFLNGAVVAEENLGIFTPQTSYPLYFGQRPSCCPETRYWGAMDEIGIFNRALAPTEVQAIVQAGGAGVCRPGEPSRRAYVSNLLDGTVTVIDTGTNMPAPGSPISVGLHPRGVAVHPSNRYVYVATNTDDPGPGKVVMIDALNNNSQTSITVGHGPFGLAMDAAGTTVYSANQNDHTISAIATPTHPTLPANSVDTFSAGFGASALAVSPDGTRVYLVNNLNSTLSVIDAVHHNQIGVAVPLAGAVGAADIAVHPTGSPVYVADPDADRISVVDVSAADLIANPPTVTEISQGIGTYPQGLALNQDGTRLYVTNRCRQATCDSSVSVIDTTLKKVIDTIVLPTGSFPLGVAVAASGTELYVVNAGISDAPGHTVSVIDIVNDHDTLKPFVISVGSFPLVFGRFATIP